MIRRTGILAALLAIVVLFTFQVSPAFAISVPEADKAASDHDGDADKDSSTSYNEDNDTNDGGTANNVEDDGDNAHPSGKDRSVENGKSGNQGNSESDPDDDGRGPDRSNGGPDKANGSGGVDKADQDGNNGCGNDDDFEDDNEGWCGKPPKTDTEVEGTSEEICVDDTMGTETKVCDEDTVEGDSDEVDGSTDTVCEDVMATTDDECGEDDSVLGNILNRATTNSAPSTVDAAGEVAGAPGVLPFTGASLIPFAITGLGMIAAGAALARRKR